MARQDPHETGYIDRYQFSVALGQSAGGGAPVDVARMLAHSTPDGRIDYRAYVAEERAAVVAQEPAREGAAAAAHAELAVQQQALERERERAAAAAREEDWRLEESVSRSVGQLEAQLDSVQREAAEVLSLCDATTTFTNEVRDGLRSCRVSMGEQRHAMDSVLSSVSDRLRSAHTPAAAAPADPDGAGARIEYLEAELARVCAERDALTAHVRENGSELSSTESKQEWKIQWLSQKLENVEIAAAERHRALEEELELVRARHRDGLLRVRELEEQLSRADTLTTERRRASGGKGKRGGGDDATSRQGKLLRDIDALLARVEQLRRDAAADVAADRRLIEDSERERRALLDELLDVEARVAEKRRAAEHEAEARRSEQLQLRGDVARGRAELAGEGRDDSTRVLELEQELVRGQGQGEAQGMRG